ncbi:manganese efflux pump MntP [Aminipila terrae]|uniref:Putative manganese efflux pump MntP n=1 Tax=Aminipila terrae TaxID=2697030 RepID=A0A6P1MD96_9FIRM|nr:manganese efflux pump MntP family protein [Aminipila terrae]QHI71992.1 manganese efflux pump [Aminipila terrae]
MTLTEIILIGAGLAMDAVAVSMTNGMVYRNLKPKDYIAMPLLFGGFQALMPLIGNFAGSLFTGFISKYAGIVILLILGFIGGKMIKEGFEHRNQPKQACGIKKLSFGVLAFQAIATSIDAFAVGVGFSAIQVNIIQAVTIIAIVTVILTIMAIYIGRKFGDILGCQAEILGG